MNDFEIKKIKEEDRSWVKQFINDHWGSNMVVIHGKKYIVDNLRGFIAFDKYLKKIGLITYTIEKNECHIITLDSTIENMGIGTRLLENVKDIAHAQRVLDYELKRYNFKQIHSTTGEIPYIRFQKALDEGKSLFRQFVVPKPFLLIKDIFCLRADRTIDNYRTTSIGNKKFKLNCHDGRVSVNVRFLPIGKNLVELRFWYKDKLIDVRRVKKSELKLSSFHL